MFGKLTVYKQKRNAVLFLCIASEVFFPVVSLHSCKNHMLDFFFNIKDFVRSDLKPDITVAESISEYARRNHLHVWPTFLSAQGGGPLLLFKKKSCLCRISSLSGYKEVNKSP